MEQHSQSTKNPHDEVWCQVTLEVPPFLLGTVLGDRLVRRMLYSQWKPITEEDIPPAWRDPVPNEFLLQAQKKIGLKRGEAETPACTVCQKPTHCRCAICLTTRYCSRRCQTNDWQCHKSYCKAPPARLDHHVAITLPDFVTCYAYRRWLSEQPGIGVTAVCIENTATWIEAYGESALKRTFLSMAICGKPVGIFCRVMTSKAALRSGDRD